MPAFFQRILDGALTLIFPPRCEICGVMQEPVVCARCRERFARIEPPWCRQCGLPFDPLAKSPAHCADCRDEPPPFDAARAAGLYGGTLRRAIHLFKYDGIRALAGPLGEFTAQVVEPPFAIDCLCPVPLHPKREAMRGFNQALLLAEELAACWDAPVEAGVLERTRDTPPQMRLPADERRANIRNAFAVRDAVAGRAVGLVDDVYTTGSTLREASRVLKRAGAARVLVVTVARAASIIPDDSVDDPFMRSAAS